MNTLTNGFLSKFGKKTVADVAKIETPHRETWTGKKSLILVALGILSAALVFFLDVNLKLGAAAPMLYTGVICLSAFYPGRWNLVVTGVLCSLLTLIGVYWSPDSRVLDWIVLFNRSVALFVIWLTVVFLTSQKRTEDSLRILSSLASRTTTGSFVCSLNGKITWWNAAFRSTFPAITIARQKISDLILPEHPTLTTFSSILSTLKAGEGLSFNGRTSTADSKWIQCDIEPIYDDFGNLKGAFGLIIDISEVKKEQERLQSYLQYTHSVLKNIPEGVIVFDSTLLIDTINQAAKGILYFTTDPDSANTYISDVLSDDTLQDFERHFQELKESDSDTVVFDAETSNADLSFTLAPIQDSVIGEDRYTLSITDVTRFKEALRSLKSLNAELKQFAYVASHDLQEPLRKISSFLQILEEDYGEQLPADAKECIDFAVDGANRLQNLIQDLLAFTGLSKRSDQPPASVDLNDVVSQVLLDIEFKIKESDATITVDTLPAVMGIESQLRQVFQNLIGNAVKYCDKDTKPDVKISARKTKRFYEIAVVDNGIGFDQQFTDRIFRIFQRLHSKSEYSGTGIGLAICKRIIDFHGGRIWAESTPGAGSTFFFTLRRV